MFSLITAASTSKAYSLKNSLGTGNVLLGDYAALPAVFINSGKLIQLPDPSGKSYVHQFLALCLDRNIDKIWPLDSREQDLLLNSAQLFAEYGITIIINDQL